MNGVINVYKEKGYTSFDVVAKLRGILKQKKIGHTGTLDPDATGVLPVCLGNATKLCDLLTDKSKEYEAVMILGKATDTQDISGNVICENEIKVSENEIVAVVESFLGEIEQIPPMYSAIKVNGQKLCDLARKGIEVERKPRKVIIHSISVTDISLPRVSIKVHCSKGTYIRTLIDDIGRKLGCFATMEELERVRVDVFSVSDALKLADIEKIVAAGEIDSYVCSVDEMFSSLEGLIINPIGDKLLQNGNKFSDDLVDKRINPKRAENGDGILSKLSGKYFRVYFSNNTFAGLYSFCNGEYKPYKMFL